MVKLIVISAQLPGNFAEKLYFSILHQQHAIIFFTLFFNIHYVDVHDGFSITGLSFSTYTVLKIMAVSVTLVSFPYYGPHLEKYRIC